MTESVVAGLTAFEMLIGEGHLIEVHSEPFHKEKYSK